LYQGTKHSFGTQRLAEGFNLSEVQAVMGHADQRSTLRYAKYQTEKLVDVMRGKHADTKDKKSVNKSSRSHSVTKHKSLKSKQNMAGVGGFEPPNPGSKDLCLTA
jgi:hypothetical protein